MNSSPFALVLLMLLAGCDSDSSLPKATMNEVTLLEPPPIDNYRTKAGQGVYAEVIEPRAMAKMKETAASHDKKLIKEGRISIQSNNIQRSKKALDNFVKLAKGYYQQEELENEERSITYRLTIKVPADKFEYLLTEIEKGRDKITSRRIEATDVTEEYVDIEGRLNNKRQYLARYHDILKKASTIENILAVEEHIRTLQEEIESTQGRLNFLDKQVAYSSFHITMSKEKPFVTQSDTFLQRVKVALSDGWARVVDTVLLVIANWHVVLTLIIIAVALRVAMVRRRTLKRGSST